MEVLRKYFCLTLVCLSSFCFGNNRNDSTFVNINEAIKDPKAANFILLEADSLSLSLLKENVADLAHLRGIAIQGQIANPTILWSALSEISLLEYLFFLDNDLKEIKIGGTSSTLKYLWIRNSPSLNILSLNSFLNRSNLITSLRLDHVDLVQIPGSLKAMPILKELQISNSKVNFKSILKSLGKNNTIEKLILSDNNFQLMSKGLKKLPQLKYLDLSGNGFSDEIVQLKHLKQLDTLIINRNEIGDLERAAKRIQETNVGFLVVDNQLSKVKNDIIYLLPGKEIVWENEVSLPQNIELPSLDGNSKVVQSIEPESTVKKTVIKTYNKSGDVKLLSEAYLEYDRLVFPNPLKYFDTLKYNGRYLDSSYVFVEKIEIQNHTRNEEKHKLKFNRKYGGVKKKKKTVKINHNKDSHIVFDFFEDKTCNDGPLVTLGINHIEKHKRNDFKAFQQYVWLISLDEESFRQQYINQKAWSDIRIEFDDGIFIVKLKGRFTDDEFIAELRYKRNPNDLKKLDRSVKKVFERYKEASRKEEVRFNKNVEKEKRIALRPHNKELKDLWAKVEAKMSEEEKGMSREEWLAYYKEVKASEYSLLPETSFNLAFLAKYMVSQGFREKRTNDFYVGQKWIETTLVYQADTLEIEQLCIVDIDQQIVSQVDVKKNLVLLEPFHDLVIYGVTKQKQFFHLNKEDVNLLLDKKTVQLTEEKLIKDFPKTGTFYKSNILPRLTY